MKNISYLIRVIAMGILLFSTGSLYSQNWGNLDNHMMPLSHSLADGVFAEAPFTHATILNGKLYFTDFYGLHIYDMGNPSNPVKIGAAAIPGNASHFAINGHYAYVCNGMGIAIVNLFNPALPFVVNVEFLGSKPFQVIIDGDHAYIAEATGIKSYTMPDPEHLNLLDAISLTPGTMNFAGFAQYGSRLYYVNQSYLYGVDMTNPADLQLFLTQALSTGGACWGNCAVKDHYLYVATTMKLQVYDLSNPVAPALIYNNLPTTHTIYDLVIEGNRLVLNHSNNGMWTVLDITTPSNPLVQYTSTTIELYGLYSLGALKNNLLYILDNGQNGYEGYTLHIVDLNNIVSPFVTDTIQSLAGRTKATALFYVNDEKYALVAQDNNFDTESATGILRIVNISNPSNPVLVSTLEMPKGVVSIASDGQSTAFVGLAEYSFPYYSHSIAVINLDNINNPYISSITSLGTHLSKLNHSNISYHDGKLYAVSTDNLKIFTLSAGNLILNGSTQVYGQHGFGVYANNPDYVYVAGGNAGLSLYNVSNPAVPFMVNFFNTPGNSWDVYVTNGKAYVADYAGGMSILDVSQNMIVPISQVACAGNAISITVFDLVAYVGLDDGRIQKFDVSNPAIPQSLGWYLTYGSKVNDLYLEPTTYRLYVSNEFDMTIMQLGAPVGLGEESTETWPAQVFPNPCTNETVVEIDLPGPGNADMQIFTSTGRLAKRNTLQGLKPGKQYLPINIQGLSAGVYFLEISSKDYTAARKIIVQQ